jgi:single-strand DNA-binding protein
MSAFTVHTTIEGNLTDDPILRHTASGMAVANMRVAVTSRTRASNGEIHETTQFVPVVLWRDFAVNAAASLHKGDRVMVSGDLKERSYTTNEGNTVYIREIHADALGVSLRWHVVAGVEKAREVLDPSFAAAPAAAPATA